MSSGIRVGTRGSALARTQTGQVAAALQQLHDGLEVEIITIRTSGDQLIDQPLDRLAADVKGLFVKQIEEALLDGRIDLAVHSLKDLPGEMAPGLTLAAIPEREDPRDALICASDRISELADLPPEATVATGSPRRRAQLLELRPDLNVVDIRGNVDTRLRRLQDGSLDAVILAAAGLNRLGLADRISSRFETGVMTPAVGQGALGVQIREDDQETARRVAPLDDPTTHRLVQAERQFLAAIGGGCQLPLGAHAAASESQDSFVAFWSRPGASDTRFSERGPAGSAGELAERAWRALAGGRRPED